MSLFREERPCLLHVFGNIRDMYECFGRASLSSNTAVQWGVGCEAHRVVEGMQKLTADIFLSVGTYVTVFFFQSVELSSRPTALACAFPLHCAADKKEKDTECLNETVLKVQ